MNTNQSLRRLYLMWISRCLIIVASVLFLVVACIPMDRRPEQHDLDFRDSETWGKVVEKDLQLGEFCNITSQTSAEIKYFQSDSFKVTVVGNEKAIDAYTIELIDSEGPDGEMNKVLNVKANRNYTLWTPAILVNVYAPTLFGVSVTGAGEFIIEDSVYINDFHLNISGAGDAELNTINAGDVTINLDGAGDLSLRKLKADRLTVNVTGAGDATFKKAKVKGEAFFYTYGAGDIDGEIKADHILAISTGAGGIELEVECKEITAVSGGAGDVEIEGTTSVLRRSRAALGGIKTRHLKADKVLPVELTIEEDTVKTNRLKKR